MGHVPAFPVGFSFVHDSYGAWLQYRSGCSETSPNAFREIGDRRYDLETLMNRWFLHEQLIRPIVFFLLSSSWGEGEFWMTSSHQRQS